jgi:hypothetical protein
MSMFGKPRGRYVFRKFLAGRGMDSRLRGNDKGDSQYTSVILAKAGIHVLAHKNFTDILPGTVLSVIALLAKPGC